MEIVIDHEKCNGCAVCISNCPSKAIALNRDVAEIDFNLCNYCLNCLLVCPCGAISAFETIATSKKLTQIPNDDLEIIEAEPVYIKEQAKKTVLTDIGKVFLPSLFKMIGYIFERWGEDQSLSKDNQLMGNSGKITKLNRQRHQRRKRAGRK